MIPKRLRDLVTAFSKKRQTTSRSVKRQTSPRIHPVENFVRPFPLPILLSQEPNTTASQRSQHHEIHLLSYLAPLPKPIAPNPLKLQIPTHYSPPPTPSPPFPFPPPIQSPSQTVIFVSLPPQTPPPVNNPNTNNSKWRKRKQANNIPR